MDHNLDTEKEFFTPNNTLGHVPHLYRTEMKNSLDANSGKWKNGGHLGNDGIDFPIEMK